MARFKVSIEAREPQSLDIPGSQKCRPSEIFGNVSQKPSAGNGGEKVRSASMRRALSPLTDR
jgi:hypothetical protein